MAQIQETGERLEKAREALGELREMLDGTATPDGYKMRAIKGALNTLTVAIGSFEAIYDTLKALNNQSEVALLQARNYQKMLTAPVGNGDVEKGGKGD